MFDEMVERIQRTTISTLLKVKIEVRPAQPAPAPQQAPAAQPAQPAPAQPRVIRRQMPVPLAFMSSSKEDDARRAAELKKIAEERAAKSNNEDK